MTNDQIRRLLEQSLRNSSDRAGLVTQIQLIITMLDDKTVKLMQDAGKDIGDIK